MEETMREVIELVKTASENLWAAGYARAWAVIATDILWVVAFALLVVGCIWFTRYAKSKFVYWSAEHERDWHNSDADESKDIWEVWMWASAAVAVVGAFFFCICLNCLLGHILAPDYLAIQLLIELVK